MSPSVWPVFLLAAPLLIGLAASYPHRGYHDEVDGEKNVRHIDGLGGVAGRVRRQDVSSVARDVEGAVRRQVEEQVRATGSGSASGQWSVQQRSEYSGVAPVRATITGEALQGGDGLGLLTTNCHNCRIRVRKVGGGSSSLGVDQGGADGSVQQAGAAGAASQRYYSASGYSSQSRHGSGYSGDLTQGAQGSGYSAHGSGYSGQGSSYSAQGSGYRGGYSGGQTQQASSDRLVQSARYGGYGETQQTQQRGQEAFDDLAAAGSSRQQSSVTRSSWRLSDLGYGTTDLADLVRRMDDDLRAGRYQNGKTVTTVTSSVSENGGAPVTKTETFVKDGLDLSQFPSHSGAGLTIGNSEVEDLLRDLQQELRAGKTQAGKTVTTVVESSSVNGGTPVVKKQTFVRDGFDASALDARFGLDQARLDADAARLAAAAGQGADGAALGSSRTSSYSTHTTWTSGGLAPGSVPAPRAPQMGPVDHLGGGHLVAQSQRAGSSHHDVRTVDSLGGGHLIRETGSAGYGASADHLKGTRRVDALGGGHLLRETGGYGAYSSQGSAASVTKDTRRVDALGGGHLLRETGPAPQSALPASETMSVAQMPGYRKEAPVDSEDSAFAGTAGTSKYYASFQSSSYTGGAADGALASGQQQQQQQQHGLDATHVGGSGDTRTSSSSSSYRKTVSYSSSVGEREVDRLGGGHLIRDVPQLGVGDVGGGSAAAHQALVEHQQQQGGRIPEAAPGSYFSSGSSSYQQRAAGRAEYAADVQETRDAEYPPLGPSPAVSRSVKQGFSSYGGLASAAAGPTPDAAPTRGGPLSVSLMDLGVMGSQQSQQGLQAHGGQSYGSSYSHGSGYSSRHYERSEDSVPASSTSWSRGHTGQAGYAHQDSRREQRMSQVQGGGIDCDQGIKI